MWHKTSAPKLAVIGALVLLLATTALAAAQSPDLLLPLVTGGGQAEQVVPDMPGDEGIPPLVEEELDPNAPVGDSQDTHSGDYDQAPADIAAVDAFNATQWTVQNNLGIGTDAPTSDIDLSRNVNNYTRIWVRNPNTGANAQTQLALTTANSYSLALQQFGSGFSASWNGKSLKNMARLRTSPLIQGLILTTAGSYPLIMGTADQERLRIAPDGKVGIGTTTPAHRLSIAAGPLWTPSGWGGAVDLPDGSAIGWRPNSVGNSYGMGHATNGFYFFRTTSAPGTTAGSITSDMIIDNVGLVGIGTTAPLAKLHVQGVPGVDGMYVNGPGLNGMSVSQPGGHGVYVSQPGLNGVEVFQPTYDGVYVSGPGRNGISVIEPVGHGVRVKCPCGGGSFPNSGVLVEDGNIRVQNGSFIDDGTTLNVPDYVFEPDYHLLSLDELREYVAEEKHLPNVPNEEEIRAGGLDLSDFQMKLLEKTEELTLYTLAQDEQIERLQQTNQAQSEQLETLRQENQAKDEQLAAMQEMIADLEARLAALEAQAP